MLIQNSRVICNFYNVNCYFYCNNNNNNNHKFCHCRIFGGFCARHSKHFKDNMFSDNDSDDDIRTIIIMVIRLGLHTTIFNCLKTSRSESGKK
jgi:hypothetical protein